LIHFAAICHIFSILVHCAMKNLATLVCFTGKKESQINLKATDSVIEKLGCKTIL
jgi:hypothetical protein